MSERFLEGDCVLEMASPGRFKDCRSNELVDHRRGLVATNEPLERRFVVGVHSYSNKAAVRKAGQLHVHCSVLKSHSGVLPV